MVMIYRERNMMQVHKTKLVAICVGQFAFA